MNLARPEQGLTIRSGTVGEIVTPMSTEVSRGNAYAAAVALPPRLVFDLRLIEQLIKLLHCS